MTPQACHLHVLIARGAPTAVIFRRGPKRQTRLIRWDLKTDTFKPGQWLKHNIYVRRCDLSPSGDYLVYFAARHHGDVPAYTAISRPPYFTALALWPKSNTFDGGGLFETETRLILNHQDYDPPLAEGFSLPPKKMRVHRNDDLRVWDGDWPLHHELLQINGWTALAPPELKTNSLGISYTRFPAFLSYEKLTASGFRLVAKMSFQTSSQTSYQVFSPFSELVLDLPAIDWADWGDHGDLLFACKGRLFRLKNKQFGAFAEHGEAAATGLADFNNMRFEPVIAPREAMHW